MNGSTLTASLLCNCACGDCSHLHLARDLVPYWGRVCALLSVRKLVANFILLSILKARERNASEQRTKEPVHLCHYEDTIVLKVWKDHFISGISISVES